MNEDGFVFYGSFYRAAKRIEDSAKRCLLLECLIRYGLGEELPEDMPDDVMAVLDIASANIDAARQRYQRARENGSKGGRPKKGEYDQFINGEDKQPEKKKKAVKKQNDEPWVRLGMPKELWEMTQK